MLRQEPYEYFTRFLVNYEVSQADWLEQASFPVLCEYQGLFPSLVFSDGSFPAHVS